MIAAKKKSKPKKTNSNIVDGQKLFITNSDITEIVHRKYTCAISKCRKLGIRMGMASGYCLAINKLGIWEFPKINGVIRHGYYNPISFPLLGTKSITGNIHMDLKNLFHINESFDVFIAFEYGLCNYNFKDQSNKSDLANKLFTLGKLIREEHSISFEV